MCLAFPPPREYRANLLGMMAYVARYGRVPPSESGDWPLSELIEFQEAVAGFVSQENEVQERD
jgi:hypothetical protein